ncbi:hypothetical protein F383_00227 [Gossypium arboreum]|uniref:Uncharacterized protein n=1 Tax=Gossypium arboreum TaxID=29729 RepID=A0A0B0MVV2_GOSAR|nr:hypothetical protein F383_00227 [Gossypium arboreum]
MGRATLELGRTCVGVAGGHSCGAKQMETLGFPKTLTTWTYRACFISFGPL